MIVAIAAWPSAICCTGPQIGKRYRQLQSQSDAFLRCLNPNHENSNARLDLKTTFNTVASLYDEVRPGYPDELVRDVLDLSGMDRSGKILEVGCGTGQASRLFATLGCEMTCLDIGQDLIEVARARLNNYKNVRFVLCPFEDWNSASKFDLVIAATAFRWVCPNSIACTYSMVSLA